MNYPFLILSFFLVCCLICFMTFPVMAAETSEPEVTETEITEAAAFTETEATETVVSTETVETTEALDSPYTESLYPEEYLDPIEAPVETEPVYVQVIQDTGNAIVHADLFGAFLICGTLVGIFLLRGRYGT